VRAGLDNLGIAYRIDHRLVRGLDYYVRTVFEIQPPVTGGQSTLGGGGRYDPLMELLGGPPTPAIGFGTGIERIIGQLEAQAVAVPVTGETRVYIAWQGDCGPEASRLARDVRAAGVVTIAGLGGRSLKAQMKHANQVGATVAVILGDDRTPAGHAAVRDLVSGEQRDELLAAIPTLFAPTPPHT
jgi:histidyl-tRNA synthetase